MYLPVVPTPGFPVLNASSIDDLITKGAAYCWDNMWMVAGVTTGLLIVVLGIEYLIAKVTHFVHILCEGPHVHAPSKKRHGLRTEEWEFSSDADGNEEFVHTRRSVI